MLFTEFSKHIAHSLRHERERSGGINLIFLGRCGKIRMFVIAAKEKIFRSVPLNNNFEGFNIIHGRFNFLSFRELWMTTGRDGVKFLMPHN